jgi:ATP-dependent Clp protease ATP-binding subunit ClpA
VPFGNLPPAVVHQVVQKFVLQLEAQLADRGVTFDLSEDAIKWLAEKGYDSRMGARPLGRVIQEHIKQPLADEVLFGKLKKGGTVKVTVKEDGSDLILDAIADGPVSPKPEPVLEEVGAEGAATAEAAVVKKARPKRAPKPLQAKKPSNDGGGGGAPGKRGGLVPKVPLKTS